MGNEKEIDIDLGKIFYMMKKRIIYIILATLITAVAAGCFTEFFIEPKYSASCKFYVYSNTDRVSTQQTISQTELSTSQQLVNTYIVALESDNILENVIEELDLDMTAAQLKGMISCSQINETPFFRVTVSDVSAAQAADIANAIAKVAPEEVVKVIKAGGMTVLDYAKVPSSPSSPNLKKNVLIGALAGFAVAFAGFFIYELFDTTITSEKDIEREFEIPILGTIPRLIPSSDKLEVSETSDDRLQAAANGVKKGGKK